MAKRDRSGKFLPGESPNPGGKKRADAADAKPTRKFLREDGGWMNFQTGHGVYGRDKRQATSFQTTNLDFDQLAELWRGDDLAARAVETLPKEALREGLPNLVIPEGDEGGDDEADRISEVNEKLRVLGACDYLKIALGYERGLGGGAILIGANDGQADLTQPLNLDKVRSLDWLTPLEPRELMPVYGYADPRAPKYGQPEIYRMTSRAVLPPYGGQYANTLMEIHESRLLIFPGVRISRYQSMFAQGGWGDSVLTRMWRVLRDFNLAWGSAGALVTDFARIVYKFKDLWQNLAAEGGMQDFYQRLQFMEMVASTMNASVIDADDDVKREPTPISGLPDLMDKFATRLAAAADMPLTLLFGTSPAGLNATGESDIRFYYDRVAAYQRDKIQSPVEQLVKIIFRTMGSRQEPEKWSLEFKPLWQESAKDRASTMLISAQTDASNIDKGVYSAEEAAKSHWGTGKYNPDISIDFRAREKREAAASGPVTPSEMLALQNPDAYTPPPGPGSFKPAPQTTPPGEPANPDGNTAPKPIVMNSDRMDAFVVHIDSAFEESDHPRDNDGKFSAGNGLANRGAIPHDLKGLRGRFKQQMRNAKAARSAHDPQAAAAALARSHLTRAAFHDEMAHRTGNPAHDQAAEYHRGRATEIRRAAGLVESAKRAGGFTFDPRNGSKPASGYAVAIHSDRERKMKTLDVNAVRDYIHDNHDIFERDPKAHLGGWYNAKDRTWYLDVPHVEHSLSDAARMGRETKQLAIFDLKRKEEIRNHEYENAEAGRGRFAGRTDGSSAGHALRPEGPEGWGPREDRGGDEGARAEGSPRRVVRWDWPTPASHVASQGGLPADDEMPQPYTRQRGGTGAPTFTGVTPAPQPPDNPNWSDPTPVRTQLRDETDVPHEDIVQKRGGKWVLISEKDGRTLGTYGSKSEAVDALRRAKWYGKHADDWDESQHPRDESGRFGQGEGGGEKKPYNGGEQHERAIEGENRNRQEYKNQVRANRNQPMSMAESAYRERWGEMEDRNREARMASLRPEESRPGTAPEGQGKFPGMSLAPEDREFHERMQRALLNEAAMGEHARPESAVRAELHAQIAKEQDIARIKGDKRAAAEKAAHEYQARMAPAEKKIADAEHEVDAAKAKQREAGDLYNDERARAESRMYNAAENKIQYARAQLEDAERRKEKEEDTTKRVEIQKEIDKHGEALNVALEDKAKIWHELDANPKLKALQDDARAKYRDIQAAERERDKAQAERDALDPEGKRVSSSPANNAALAEHSIVNLKELGGGTSGSYIATLESGQKAVWKPANEEATDLRPNIADGTLHMREDAAAAVAKQLGVADLVPATTIIEHDGSRGSLQSFAPNSEILSNTDGVEFDRSASERMRAFDFITGNSDRHGKNVMVNERGGKTMPVLIDNGLTFPNGSPQRFLTPADHMPHEPLSKPTELLINRLDHVKLATTLAEHGIEPDAVRHVIARAEYLKLKPEVLDLSDGAALGKREMANHAMGGYLESRDRSAAKARSHADYIMMNPQLQAAFQRHGHTVEEHHEWQRPKYPDRNGWAGRSKPESPEPDEDEYHGSGSAHEFEE